MTFLDFGRLAWLSRTGVLALPIDEIVAELPYPVPPSAPLPDWIERWSSSLDLGRAALVAQAQAPAVEVPAMGGAEPATIPYDSSQKRRLRLVARGATSRS